MRIIKVFLLSLVFSLITTNVSAFPWISPYAYCLGNPVGCIDPDGRDIFMLFYTTGNRRGDDMFKSAAETRKYDIEHSDSYDASKDIVLMCGIQDLSSIESLVTSAIESYGNTFGKTAEFSIWSHAGIDGPTGTLPTSANAIDNYQMSIEGWSNIDFNWTEGASANFYGCKTGASNSSRASFATRVSSNPNFRDVVVHGQTTSAYPSIYTNVRQNTQGMLNNTFSYPTYMVGANSLGISGKLLPTFSPASPMRSSMNGRGGVSSYFQPGRRF